MALLEAINQKSGHWSTYVAALDKGWRVAPNAGLDNHGRYGITNFSGLPERTVVLAPRLTRADLLEAMRLRRVYATWDTNLRLTYTVNGEQLGSTLAGATSLEFDIQVSDPDTGVAGDALTKIEIVTAGGAVAKTHAVSGHSASWKITIAAPLKKHYLVRVFTADRTDWTAVGAPVWTTP